MSIGILWAEDEVVSVNDPQCYTGVVAYDVLVREAIEEKDADVVLRCLDCGGFHLVALSLLRRVEPK